MSVTGGEFNGVVGGDDFYTVSISSGKFSSAVPAGYIDGSAVSVSLTSNGGKDYYIGAPEKIADFLAENTASGDAVEVYQGSLNLDGIAGGVTVSNTGSGAVTVNGQTVTDTGVTTHTHQFSSDWKYDKTSHWHVCSCGEKSEAAAHVFGEWTVTKPATETEKGVKERNCTVCGYKETAEIAVVEKPDTLSIPSEPSDTPDPDNSGVDSPKTGGSSHLVLWIAVMVLSAGGLTGAFFYSKRKKA